MIEKCTCTWLNCIEEKKKQATQLYTIYENQAKKKEISSSLAFSLNPPSPHVLYYIPTFCLRAVSTP